MLYSDILSEFMVVESNCFQKFVVLWILGDAFAKANLVPVPLIQYYKLNSETIIKNC